MNSTKGGLKIIVLVVAVANLLPSAPCAFAASPMLDCKSLANLKIPATIIVSAEPVDAGAFKSPEGTALPELRAFCRVAAVAKPSNDSDIKFEVWLPASEWNGRLWGIGNGNFAGSISYRGLGKRLAEGYATVGTDTGHHADSMDTAWASGHPEKVVDFGHRGVHEVAVRAKRIVAALYRRKASRAYFGSCSNGGREALMEAQRYPDDYDGIIAGAPAGDWTHGFIGNAVMQFVWLADNSRRVPASKLLALQSAVLAACDGLDGVKDGVIEDPQRCNFDPSTLACQGTETDRCLTSPQLETLGKLYTGQVLPSGRRLHGFPRGSEGGWQEMQFESASGASDAFKYASGFFRDFVFEDPTWDFHSFDPERDGQLTDRKLASILNATDPDLRKFAARGGKLIMYHGWSDAVIPAYASIDYYQHVVDRMGEKMAGKSVRLFLAPGMEHCGEGPGPNYFGQYDAAGTGDPEYKIGAALQRWVEQGIAPERIIATKRQNDDPKSEVVRTRPLCAYPRVARYRGEGSTDSAASFDCVGAP
jgi:Tannase and feruloyl esterase